MQHMLAAKYFVLSSCVPCQFSCPTSQQQRTAPVIMGQAASRADLTSSEHYFPAAGGLNAASVAQPVLLHWCISTTFNLHEEPPVSWCTLLPFFVSLRPSSSVWASTCQWLIFTRRTHSTHFSKPNVFHLSQEFCVSNMLFAGSVCQDFKPY